MPSHNWLQRFMRTRETSIADTTVAEKLRSAKAGKMKEVLRDHEVRVIPGKEKIPMGKHRMKVVEDTAGKELWRPGRFLGQLRPHRVRVFNLVPDDGASKSAASGSQVDVKYIPMTEKHNWGNDLTSASAALQRTQALKLAEGELGVTPGLSGCSVVRKNSGTVGHLEPISGKKIGTDPSLPLPSTRSQTALMQHTNAQGVFGPIDYDLTRESRHVRTNAFVIGTGKPQDTLVSQSVHWTDTNDGRKIKTRKRKI